jgi:hypothetical protein
VLKKPKKSRWASFVAAPVRGRASRGLEEEDNPSHRARVEYNRDTILVHPSGEAGPGRTLMAVDRKTRQGSVAQAKTRLAAAAQAFHRLSTSLRGGR